MKRNPLKLKVLIYLLLILLKIIKKLQLNIQKIIDVVLCVMIKYLMEHLCVVNIDLCTHFYVIKQENSIKIFYK